MLFRVQIMSFVAWTSSNLASSLGTITVDGAFASRGASANRSMRRWTLLSSTLQAGVF